MYGGNTILEHVSENFSSPPEPIWYALINSKGDKASDRGELKGWAKYENLQNFNFLLPNWYFYKSLKKTPSYYLISHEFQQKYGKDQFIF